MEMENRDYDETVRRKRPAVSLDNSNGIVKAIKNLVENDDVEHHPDRWLESHHVGAHEALAGSVANLGGGHVDGDLGVIYTRIIDASRVGDVIEKHSLAAPEIKYTAVRLEPPSPPFDDRVTRYLLQAGEILPGRVSIFPVPLFG